MNEPTYPAILPDSVPVYRHKHPIYGFHERARSKRGIIGWAMFDGVPVAYHRKHKQWHFMPQAMHPPMPSIGTILALGSPGPNGFAPMSLAERESALRLVPPAHECSGDKFAGAATD